MEELNHFEKIELSEDVRSIALAPQIFRLTKTIVNESSVKERFEQGGFLGGVVKDGTFYVWNNRHTAQGDNGGCVLYDKLGDFLEVETDFHVRRMEAIPNFRAVRYHSHPPINSKILREGLSSEDAESLIGRVREEYDSGIFSFLGITSLDEAINETFSRQLSPEDLQETNGRYHLLISPTIYGPGRPFSHLNFYDLQCFGEKLVPFRLASESELEPYLNIEEAVRINWKKETFGDGDLWNLSPEKLERVYRTFHCPHLVED